MSYLDMSIEELHNLIVEGKLDPKDLIKESYEKAIKLQGKLNGFVTFNESCLTQDLSNFDKTNPLFGIPFAIKDNFSTKGIRTTGSSKILENYVPVFDSTVYSKLINAGAVCIGKNSMDELALGGTGLNPATGPVHNPWNLNRISGGSSAGSVVSVAAGIVPFAIGSDTGDSVRKPAALNGVVGFKPTWGRISRYGLFPFAPSLDHVAYFTRNVKDSAFLLDCLAGYDCKDMSTFDKKEEFVKNLNIDLRGKKIAVINQINSSLNNPKVKENLELTIQKCAENGATILNYDIDERLLKAILPVYLVISCSEATSNDANLDGIKFGPRGNGSTYVESMINTRTEGFSELVKRRFAIGGYCLREENQEKLFLKAQKVRNKIVNIFNEIFNDADVVLFPAAGDIARMMDDNSAEELSNNYLIGENHLAIGNFGGFPSITIPSGFVDGMPVAINITGKAFDDQKVLNIAASIEDVLGFKIQIAKVGE